MTLMKSLGRRSETEERDELAIKIRRESTTPLYFNTSIKIYKM